MPGMLDLHVDDACFSGDGSLWEKALSHIRTHVILGKEEYVIFIFLGRPFHQKDDYTSVPHQADYVNAMAIVFIPKARRARPGYTLTGQAQHNYRSLVGQLAWPTRETMPRLSYSVSDLPHTVEIATVGDLIHANQILNFAKTCVIKGHNLQFLHLDHDRLSWRLSYRDT